MNKNVVLVAVVLGVTSLACARRVVLDPDVAVQKNSADWTVKSEPRKAPEASEPAQATAKGEPRKVPAKGGARRAAKKP